MLEKPDLPDETIEACLRDEYGIEAAEIAFLPLGADAATAVYRVNDDTEAYFLKLRHGDFDETAVAVPRFLSDHGVGHIITPVQTRDGRLWTRVSDFAATLYPFVEGWNGREAPPLERHWVELGVALRAMHTLELPPSLAERIPRETFSSYWRDMVRGFQARVEDTVYAESVAARCAQFVREKRREINGLVARAEELAEELHAQPPPYVLCHGDIHAWNLLIEADGALYIVDWDTLILAPKERDLMFVGAGLGIGDTPEEAALFYRGYRATDINLDALAYYRFERIVEDIAAFCQQLLLTDEGGADREQALGYLTDSFLPGHVVERAYGTDW
ncbi:MAG: aminoglycoside phosphotransferase family protein [Anaerolineae bacterium]